MLGVWHIAAAAAGVVLILAGAAGAQPPQLQHVTLIGDSVADAIRYDPIATATLSAGIDLDLEVAPCRRVDQASCTVDGVQPPNVVQLAQQMGSTLGPNVVVAVGYNDFEDQYAQNIENALAALEAAGVKRVWWLTLRAAEHPYLSMNDDIEAAALKHPEMSVIDWNLYSRSHPEWFQPDGVHLRGDGADAMATLIHKRLVKDGIAPQPVAITTGALPLADRLKPYSVTLRATGGLHPLHWSLLEPAPAGLHLLANGTITGKPLVEPGRYVLHVRVNDSCCSTETRSLALRVRR